MPNLKRSFQLVFMTLCFLLSSTVAQTENLQDLRAGVIKIHSFNKFEGKLRTGTGFIVRLEDQATYIATAVHVVGG